ILEDGVPLSLAEAEGQALEIGRLPVGCLATTVHGYLHGWTQMIEGILTPVEVDRQVAGNPALLDESHRARGVASADGRRDTEAGEVGERRDGEKESRDESRCRQPCLGEPAPGSGGGSTPQPTIPRVAHVLSGEDCDGENRQRGVADSDQREQSRD